VYNDTLGLPTIGYGHLLLEHERGVLVKITIEQGQQLFKDDMAKAVAEVEL
jgi:GH24 family phage-related lysozyme (muramidase)